MDIVRYDSDSTVHQGHMVAMLTSRDMDLELMYDLPETGVLIIKPDGTAIAAGFLRQCESKAVMLDSMITHADAEPMTRDYALDKLVETLVNLGKEYGFSQILAFTMDKNTLVRAHKHGFSLLPHSVIALRLSNGE